MNDTKLMYRVQLHLTKNEIIVGAVSVSVTFTYGSDLYRRILCVEIMYTFMHYNAYET